MSSYQVTDYLLDRANIQDTTTKLMLYLDLNQTSKWAAEVFCDTFVMDYTSMFGGEPDEHMTPEKMAAQFKPMLDSMDAYQHLMGAILISLSYPSANNPSTPPPTTATAIANGTANIIKTDAEGGPRTNNGGRYDVELVKLDSSCTEGNPWRISKIKAVGVWAGGNTKILKPGS